MDTPLVTFLLGIGLGTLIGWSSAARISARRIADDARALLLRQDAHEEEMWAAYVRGITAVAHDMLQNDDPSEALRYAGQMRRVAERLSQEAQERRQQRSGQR